MLQRVQVIPYDPAWRQKFLAEAQQLSQALGPLVLAIHHVGSTAIPGIKAKPIVDLLLVVTSLEGLEKADDRMIALGYTPKGEYGISGRRFYMKFDESGARTFNVHGFETDHPDIERLLNLRDFLKAHPHEAQAYSQLKEDLAEQYADDLNSYTAGKGEFIQRIYAKARAWRTSMEGNPVFDQNYLKKKQYATANNLEARIAIHRRFGSNPYPWFRWVFDQLHIKPGMRIVEVGCGPGSLWEANLDRLPERTQIVLGDLSIGMAQQAQRALSGHPAFGFMTVDLQNLPFEKAAFDLVIANHMLYHVPDMQRGLAEARRVLKPGGRLIAATNGDAHMGELYQLVEGTIANSQQARWSPRRFSLENAAGLVSPFFSQVEIVPFVDNLVVTEAEPLMAYIRSMWSTGLESAGDEALQALEEKVRTLTGAPGGFAIQKSQGLVTGRA